jgi:ribosomal protein eL43
MADFNVRYGMELRKRANATAASRRAKYACPKCSKVSVRRISNSIWQCFSCNAKFAGAAYSFTTPAGEVATRLIEEFKAREKSSNKA